MKITLKNEIHHAHEMEVIHQCFDVDYQEKNGMSYLIFQNEEKEKVILKFNQTELVMTRFSEPKSVMRFTKAGQALVIIPTPMGLQHFVTDTQYYVYHQTDCQVEIHYDLKPVNQDEIFASYKMVISWK